MSLIAARLPHERQGDVMAQKLNKESVKAELLVLVAREGTAGLRAAVAHIRKVHAAENTRPAQRVELGVWLEAADEVLVLADGAQVSPRAQVEAGITQALTGLGIEVRAVGFQDAKVSVSVATMEAGTLAAKALRRAGMASVRNLKMHDGGRLVVGSL